ncbi:MAG: sensor histidine kinase [Thermoleophilia bacterium]
MSTIRTRLLVSFVVLVFLAAVAVIGTTAVLGSRAARAQIVAQLESVATLKEAEIDSWVRGLEVNLNLVLAGEQTVGQIDALVEPTANPDDRQRAYWNVQRQFMWATDQMDLFAEVFLMDVDGVVLVSTITSHEGEKHSIYDYFIGGLEGRFIQEPSYSLSLNAMTVIVAQPVLVGNDTVGVVAGRADLGSLDAIMLERTGLGETGETYLVGSNRRLLTSLRAVDRGVPETYILTEGAHQATDARAGGSGTYRGYANAQVVGVHRWIPKLRVGLLAEQEEAEALRGTREVLLIITAVAVFAVALAIVAAILLTRTIVRPLGELADTAAQISAGNLDRTATVRRRDEVGALAESFNRMTSRLRDLVHSLQRRTDQLHGVNDVNRRISEILDLQELLPLVASTVRRTFGYRAVRVYLRDEDAGVLALRTGAEGEDGGGARRMAEAVLHSGAVLRGPDGHSQAPAATSAGRGSDSAELLGGGRPQIGRAELAVPIRTQDGVIGVLHIESDLSDALDDLDVFTVQTLADQLAIAIYNSQLYKNAGELATMRERQRLARDLHDAVSQTLFAVSLIAEVLPRLWVSDPGEAAKRTEELRRLTKGALGEMRILLMELRPAALADAPFKEIVRQLADVFTGRTGVPVALHIDDDPELPADVKVAFYRIVQEALNNIQKYARATEVVVEYRREGESVDLVVRDDGVGFDPSAVTGEHMGVRIISERALAVGGEAEVRSRIGEGTVVVVGWQAGG